MRERFGLNFLSEMTANSYMPAFIIGVALAVLAVLSVWILIPKIEPLKPRGYESNTSFSCLNLNQP